MAKNTNNYTVRKDGASVAYGKTGGSRSMSRTYDYSAVDEARKSRADSRSATAAAASAAFGGDVGKAIAAGTTIRSLQQKAREAEQQGVRVRSESSSSRSPGYSSKYSFDNYDVDGNKTDHVFPPQKKG